MVLGFAYAFPQSSRNPATFPQRQTAFASRSARILAHLTRRGHQHRRN